MIFFSFSEGKNSEKPYLCHGHLSTLFSTDYFYERSRFQLRNIRFLPRLGTTRPPTQSWPCCCPLCTHYADCQVTPHAVPFCAATCPPRSSTPPRPPRRGCLFHFPARFSYWRPDAGRRGGAWRAADATPRAAFGYSASLLLHGDFALWGSRRRGGIYFIFPFVSGAVSRRLGRLVVVALFIE